MTPRERPVGGGQMTERGASKVKRARRTKYGTWATPVTINGLNADGMQTSGTYIGRRNGTVEQWVDL